MITQLNGMSREEFFAFPLNGNYNNIENHAFKFIEDKWDFSALLKYPENYNVAKKHVDFHTLPEEIRQIFKRFTFHLLSSQKPQTVGGDINQMKSVINHFMNEYNLTSMAQFDTAIFMTFNAWLRKNYIEKCLIDKQKSLSEITLYQKAKVLKKLLDMATLFEWEDAPSEHIDMGDTSLYEIWGQNRKSLRDKSREIAESRLIPRLIWDTIVNKARKEDKFHISSKRGHTYQTIYRSGQAKGIKAVNFSKYLILVLAWTGLRISEITTLNSGCVFQDRRNRHWLRRTTTKTVIEPTDGDIRIPEELYRALLELESLTKEYRQRSGIDRLFFSVGGGNNKGNIIAPVSSDAVKTTFLLYFSKRNPVYGEDGELYHYTPHCFRHTLVSILVNDFNVSPTTMMRHYAHLSLEMTIYYTHLSKQNLMKRAMQSFVNADKILFNGKEGELFVKKLNEAKAEKDLDTAIAKLADIFGVSSLPTGICIYDYRRGHCPNLGVVSCWEIECDSFATNDSFLMGFEHQRDILEEQIERDKNLGQVASAKMKNIKHGKVVKIIGKLTKGV